MSKLPSRVADLSPQEKRALLSQLLQEKARQSSLAFPLSYGQQALWFTYQLAPESWAYNTLFSARIRSQVDIPALQRALQRLLDRHRSLRTTYAVRDGEPEQRVHEHQQLHVEAIDASTWTWEVLQDRLTEEARRPFDLEHGPLMRVNLFMRSTADYILLLTVHHIAIDFWSLGVLLGELRQLYPAEKISAQPSLPSLDQQYADYVRWQAGMLVGPEGEQLWAYWQQQLGGELPVLHLPTDRPRPPAQTYGGATHPFTLNQELTRQLKALAKAESATLYMVLLAAFDVLLYRYTGQEDILVGAFMANRIRPEFRRIVGYFVNPVILRAGLSGNPPFKAFLGQVRHTVLAALQHQSYPFSLLVERLQPVRDASRSPLFQVAFVLQQLHQQEELVQCFVPGATEVQIDFGGLVLEPFALPQQEGQFDLTLEMAEVDGLLYGGLKYNADLFDAATIARMAGHFQTLLEGIVANPEQYLSTLPLLTEAERQQLLVTWNDTQTDYPSDQCIHQLFEAQVERTPDAMAAVFAGEHLTYRQLNRKANQLAHHLRSLGVGPEVLVGICVERSLAMLVGLLGILKAGGAYVPLDPAYPRERLAFMLEDARVPVLLTQKQLLPDLPAYGGRVVCLDSDWEIMAGESQENLVSGTTPATLAYVIYTSGSTGRPKGVLGHHRGMVNRFAWMWEAYPFEAEEVCCQKTSLNFVDSVWELFGPLLQGIRTVIVPDADVKDPHRLVQVLAAKHVTRMVLVPSLLEALLRTCEALQGQLPKLKMWITSGEPLSGELCQRFVRSMPGSVLLNLYGSSEVAADVTCYEAHQAHGDLARVPIGRPIANTRIYLLDAHQNLVPVGIPGELHVGGAGVARGYLNRSELSAERFVPNPFRDEPETCLYKTGDLARYLPDGAIEFLGRLDNQVKIRGFRIELGEIEAVLSQHPAVREVVIVAREDVPGAKCLLAYVVPARKPAPAASALRSFLKEKLPDYMIPSAFVILDALPLTPNGKVNRLALPAPDQVSPALERAFVAPRTPVEETLADMWSQVLGIQRLSIHDNFFELGGHSLLAVQLMSRIQQTFDREIPLASLFQAPTMADFALLLEDIVADSSLHFPVPIKTTGTRPPLFCMHPAGGNVMVYQSLATFLGPEQPLYGLQSGALSDATQEHHTLNDMATDYAAIIRRRQPQGPYYLLGWSMGGVLAVAVADLLERQRQSVAFVGLFDTYLPVNDHVTRDHDPLLVLVLTFGGTIAGALAALDPVKQQLLRAELLALSPKERLQRIIAWGQERHLLSADLPLEALQRQAALTEIHVALCKAHKATPIQAPLYVWWARDDLHGRQPRTDWSRYTRGTIHTEIAEGNHFSMIQSPHVQVLAEQLKKCLQLSR